MSLFGLLLGGEDGVLQTAIGFAVWPSEQSERIKGASGDRGGCYFPIAAEKAPRSLRSGDEGKEQSLISHRLYGGASFPLWQRGKPIMRIRVAYINQGDFLDFAKHRSLRSLGKISK